MATALWIGKRLASEPFAAVGLAVMSCVGVQFSFGMSLLCSGDRDKKLRVVFDVLDEDRNEKISPEELMQYFRSLREVFQETSGKRVLGVDLISNCDGRALCFGQGFRLSGKRMRNLRGVYSNAFRLLMPMG